MARRLCIEIDELNDRIAHLEVILDKYGIYRMDGRAVLRGRTWEVSERRIALWTGGTNPPIQYIFFIGDYANDNFISYEPGGSPAFQIRTGDGAVSVGDDGVSIVVAEGTAAPIFSTLGVTHRLNMNTSGGTLLVGFGTTYKTDVTTTAYTYLWHRSDVTTNSRIQIALSPDGVNVGPALTLDKTGATEYAQISADAIKLMDGTVTIEEGLNVGAATGAGTGEGFFNNNVQIKGPRPWIDVRAYGAVGDGVTDDTVAIQAAADAANAAGTTLLFSVGTYRIITTLTISCSTVSYGATIEVDHVDANPGVRLFGTDIDAQLPYIEQMNKVWEGGTPTIGTDVGLEIYHTYSSRVSIPNVKNFSIGVLLTATNSGCVYNSISIGNLWNNAINLRIAPTGTGWVNENQFHGGRYKHVVAEGTNVVGTRQIEILDTSTHQPNNNQWFGGSIEGDVAEWHLWAESTYCAFTGLRWETSNPPAPKVRWTNGAQGNMISGGFAAVNIVVTEDGGSVSNSVIVSTFSSIIEVRGSGRVTIEPDLLLGGSITGSTSSIAKYYVTKVASQTPADGVFADLITFTSSQAGTANSDMALCHGLLFVAETTRKGGAPAHSTVSRVYLVTVRMQGVANLSLSLQQLGVDNTSGSVGTLTVQEKAGTTTTSLTIEASTTVAGFTNCVLGAHFIDFTIANQLENVLVPAAA